MKTPITAIQKNNSQKVIINGQWNNLLSKMASSRIAPLLPITNVIIIPMLISFAYARLEYKPEARYYSTIVQNGN